jgi:hypothetical protein
LYDYNARFYDPQLGRFTQPDSLVAQPYHPIAWNRYAYVYDNPVNYTDSSGHFIDTLWDIVDLGVNAQNCLGDSDALACYMTPVAAAAVVAPFLTTGGFGDDAVKAAVWRADDEFVTFYHGTGVTFEGENRVAKYFEEGKTIEDFGTGDFGNAFYTARPQDEGIYWAVDRYDNPHLIKIDIPKTQFDRLKGVNIHPFEYQHGYRNTTERARGGILSRAEIDANYGLTGADYLYGPATFIEYIQYAFKSPLAFEVLNNSPRTIYKVLDNNEIQFIKRIDPR